MCPFRGCTYAMVLVHTGRKGVLMKEKNVVISKQAVQVHVHEQKEAIMGKITR